MQSRTGYVTEAEAVLGPRGEETPTMVAAGEARRDRKKRGVEGLGEKPVCRLMMVTDVEQMGELWQGKRARAGNSVFRSPSSYSGPDHQMTKGSTNRIGC